VAFAADGGIIAVEVGFAAVEQRTKLNGAEHLHMLVGSAFTAGVAVFNDGVALALHHAREAQCLAGKGAVTVRLSMLGMEDAN
jgi:hypothetical protein